MNPLLIYTPQNGDMLKTVLDATVALMTTSTFNTAMEIMLTFAVCLVGYQYVAGKKLQALMKFVLTSFFVTYCLLGLKVKVAIIDMQEAEGAGSALTIDNVPIGIALPAAIISGIGYGLTSAFSFVFHMPADMDYINTGMVFGARTWLSASTTRLSLSPDLAADMSSYIRQCVFGAKLLASHEITPQALVNSTNLIETYFNRPSPIYRVIFQDGENHGCIEAASLLKTRLPIAAKLELERLNHLLTKSKSAKDKNSSPDDLKPKFGESLEAAHDFFMGISANASNILTQNILINATRDAASDAFAFAGADAELMNYTNTTSMQKMHVAESNSFWLASFRLPYYMTIMWALTLCIFPLVILIAYFPSMQNVYVIYLQSQAYLWSWPPMFIIIHFFVSWGASITINLFGQKTGGVTFSNIDALTSMHSNIAYTAGALAASVPFLAYYITKGLPSILSQAAQHFGGMAQSVSSSEAQTAAQGNISMASYSGWNMNYDNTNAHKFDTNYHHAEGRSTVQTSNGALLSQTADGSHIVNVQPAISNSAVSVHASDRVVDSLHHSANESFSNANQLRTAGDKHIQEGLSALNQFTTNDSNDYRSGEGVSNTTTNSISEDLRAMKDAVKHYNKHHDVSGHVSLEGAISERFRSNKQILGKIFELGTGAAVDGHVTLRGQGSTNHSTQWFNNSSEGQAFNEAYHHMESTVKNNHLDAADSHNLSRAEQIGANLTVGQSLLEQSSSEYAHGMQLQTAASHAKEQAEAIDKNLGQAYHDWVLAKHGGKGEQVMLKTDAKSIATQSKWAEEFLNSNHGQDAVKSEASSILSQTGKEFKSHYKADAAKITETSGIKNQYHRDSHRVDSNAKREGFTKMTLEQQLSSKEMQLHNRLQNVGQKATEISGGVQDTLDTTNKKIDHKELNKEK